MSRDWTISAIGAVACHLLALYGLQTALHEPARLIPETTVEVSLIAPPAGPAAAAPSAASVVEDVPPVTSPKPAPIAPPAPPPMIEPAAPEPTPAEPEPEPVAAQPEPREQPATVSPPANVGQAAATAVASAGGAVSARTATGPVSNRAANSASALPGQPAHPRYRHNPSPEYPPLARQRRQEGLVLLGVRVTAEGRAAEVTIKQSSGFPLLDAAAVKAVQRWEFEPARLGAIAVASDVEVPVRFQLGN